MTTSTSSRLCYSQSLERTLYILGKGKLSADNVLSIARDADRKLRYTIKVYSNAKQASEQFAKTLSEGTLYNLIRSYGQLNFIPIARTDLEEPVFKEGCSAALVYRVKVDVPDIGVFVRNYILCYNADSSR